MNWFEVLICFLIIFCTGLGIFLYGIWAGKQTKKPLGFWANGMPLDSKAVLDISGYNKAYGKLFRRYGIPYMAAGFMMLFSAVSGLFAYISLGILVFSCTFDLFLLIRTYKKIEKQYILE